jgi:hypothetical protein
MMTDADSHCLVTAGREYTPQQYEKCPEWCFFLGSPKVSIGQSVLVSPTKLVVGAVSFGGELEYLHPSPVSRRMGPNENPVSNETVRYGLKFYATRTRETALAKPSSTCTTKSDPSSYQRAPSTSRSPQQSKQDSAS